MLSLNMTQTPKCTPPVSHIGKLATAHWMVSGVRVNYVKQLEQARAAGIDALALNYGGWNLDTNRNAWLNSIKDIFDASLATPNSPKLFFSFDMTSLNTAEVLSVSKQYGCHPQHLWYDNKMFLSTFSGDALEWTNSVLNPLKASGLPAFFVPMFAQWSCPSINAYNYVNGLFRWINPVSHDDDMAVDAQYARLKPQRFWMAGVAPWFYKHYPGFNWGNPLMSQMFYDKWESLLVNDPHAIQLVTWNDLGESSYYGPAGAEGGVIGDQPWAHLDHAAFLDVAKHYITHWKTGRPDPKAPQRVWYYHMPQLINAAAQDAMGYPSHATVMKNEVIVLVRHTGDITVVVKSGNAVTERKLNGGVGKIVKVLATAEAGTVSITVSRNDVVVARHTSTTTIADRVQSINLNVVAFQFDIPVASSTSLTPSVTPPVTPPSGPVVAPVPTHAVVPAETYKRKYLYGCNTTPLVANKRRDCLATNEGQCVGAGCCWSPLTAGSSAPWCYNPEFIVAL